MVSGSIVLYQFKASYVQKLLMLSRYTNVTHTVTPITSGYRLVLNYNLVMGGCCGTTVNPFGHHTESYDELFVIFVVLSCVVVLIEYGLILPRALRRIMALE